MRFQRYADQEPGWPQSGRHIMAQFDADSIYVYQAYRSAIARFAIEHQRFGGEFSFNRMSWIKPNFLWMSIAELAGSFAERWAGPRSPALA